MLDILSLIYITFSTLSLLGMFPIGIFEFLDTREGFAISDYGYLVETSTYFSISMIITGLLCGLDSITNVVYKKVDKLLYNYHAISSFALIGVGLYPLTGEPGWPFSRILHWVFASSFLFLYPITRLLILRYFDKGMFQKLLIIFVSLNFLAILVFVVVDFKKVAYPEYLIFLSLLITIVVSKLKIQK